MKERGGGGSTTQDDYLRQVTRMDGTFFEAWLAEQVVNGRIPAEWIMKIILDESGTPVYADEGE